MNKEESADQVKFHSHIIFDSSHFGQSEVIWEITIRYTYTFRYATGYVKFETKMQPELDDKTCEENAKDKVMGEFFRELQNNKI